ncbi:MAG TPA: hypothetical protein VKA46_30750 [Gemmataceae bacterium]|nr:hypothetical protein [Gemmataceae bacterium]
MTDLAAQLRELQNDFQRIADRAPWVRAVFTVGVRRIGRCEFHRQGDDGGVETLLSPVVRELVLLTVRAGGLLWGMRQAGTCIANLLPPELFTWQFNDPVQPWLAYLLHARPTMQYCGAQAPEGTRPCAVDHLGEGEVVVEIDQYPQVCVLGLAWLKARLPQPVAAAPLSVETPPAAVNSKQPMTVEVANGKRRRGSKPRTDPKEDKRIAEAWDTGHYRTYEECGNALRMSKQQVKKAIDRHRHRPSGKRRRHAQAPE